MCVRVCISVCTYRSVRLLLAGEAEGGATLAEDVKGLISTDVLHALHSMLAVGRRAPGQALAVLHIAAQLVLIQLLLLLI